MPGAALSTILPEPDDTPVRVLLIDDSIVARAAIGRMVDATDRFMIAGAVGDAKAALAFLAVNRVELMLLDIAMPGIDGLSALPDLLAAGQGAKVLVVSTAAGVGAAATVQALALGAADTLVKPEAASLAGRFADTLCERMERLVARQPEPVPVVTTGPLPQQLPIIPHFDIVAIGASTGGIHALSALLRAIPASVDVPILITQHLPTSFMPYFAAQLAVLAGRPCDVATDLMRLRRGRITIAPGDAHIRVVLISDGTAIRLSDMPSASGCMPSVDPMFASVAATHGPRALCVVLSGMGRDGAIGAVAVRAAGGTVVIQDRATSVVWGMPGAVAAGGSASAVLSPDAIGRLIGTHRRRP